MTPRLTVIAALLLSLVLAPPAGAQSKRDRIIEDCADNGKLDGRYSASELRDARQNLPSDVAEYTDCADVLRRAELPDRGGSSNSGGGGAGTPGAGGTGGGAGGGELLTPASDEERRALEEAVSKGAEPVTVDGEEVVPGASGLAPDASRNSLPTSLLIALLALGALAIAAAVPAIRRATGRRPAL